MDSKTYHMIKEARDPASREIAKSVAIDETIPTGQVRRNGQPFAVHSDGETVVLDRKIRRSVELYWETAKRSGLTPTQAVAALCAVLGVDPAELC